MGKSGETVRDTRTARNDRVNGCARGWRQTRTTKSMKIMELSFRCRSNFNHSPHIREVRCYCNQPECVPQGYMCRGKGCFTELPSNANPSLLRAEHNAYSGCLDENFKERQCPTGYLCCEQDLCNHVDSPAMRNRLNKTLQVLVGDQRPFLGPVQPINHGGQSTDGWFKTATIAVPICGLIVLLILASLAIRLLQPVPTQSDKLGPHRMPDNGPPLLGPPKVPLV
ncbi:BMP and activin membrane-bound inhibitor homolog isoform X3 [Apis cerana]|uniref:BMP and activin membrane-bound inhibitor homolog isoform X3 n=1 Tax=Apis cerana TaxID=7461 RepID=UPI002B237DC4|nr:BMP and activin membrane-bound inhibitor homolog isoform X3 [Apis cerana]